MSAWVAAVAVLLFILTAWLFRRPRDGMTPKASGKKKAPAATLCPTTERVKELSKNPKIVRSGGLSYPPYYATSKYSWEDANPIKISNQYGSRYVGYGTSRITCYIKAYECDPGTKTIAVTYDRVIELPKSSAAGIEIVPPPLYTENLLATHKVKREGEWETLVLEGRGAKLAITSPQLA